MPCAAARRDSCYHSRGEVVDLLHGGLDLALLDGFKRLRHLPDHFIEEREDLIRLQLRQGTIELRDPPVLQPQREEDRGLGEGDQSEFG